MSNVAYEKVTPIRPHLEVVEYKVADLDDGFIMIAMQLYEELIGANLTRNQAKVAHAVCRKTYGFKKKFDRIADSQIAELARISRPKANIAKNELIAMKVLISEGGKIGPNKNIHEWQIPDCYQAGNFVPKEVTKDVSKSDTPPVTKREHTKDIFKDIKDKTPPYPPEGESKIAQEVMDYFNELTGSRCSSLTSFEKALNTVKSKGQCYTPDELKLVIRWAHVNWPHKFKPENLCRMNRFDGYLSDALVWADGQGSNPSACPHEEIVALWNAKFPAKSVAHHEWTRRRPAYRDLEAVWNGKTSQGNWRELKHMGMAFDLIGKSSLFSDAENKRWLTLDWILMPKNWGQVYEQAINEHQARKRQGVTA